MSDIQWYYTDANSQQHGPISLQQIRQLTSNGTITPQTLLWHGGLSGWTKASEIPGLFVNPAPAPSPVDSTNPYASTVPAQPVAAPPGGEFPIPYIRKSSFGLFLGSCIAGLVLILIAFALLVSVGRSLDSDQPYQEDDLSHIEDAGVSRNQEDSQDREDLQNSKNQAPGLSDAEAVKGISAFALIGLGGLCLLFGGIYSHVILYRAWHVIQAGKAQTTPGKAVGFMFIPFFSLYWMFIAYYGWSNDWTSIRSSYPNLMAAPAVSSGTFLTGCILMLVFFPVGIFFFFVMMSQMCQVTNYLASAYALSKTESNGLTGTRFY